MKRNNKHKLSIPDYRKKPQLWNNKLQLEHPDREDEYDNAYHGKSSKLDSIDLKFQSGSAFFQSDPQLDHPDELDEYDKAYLGESSELDFVAQEYEEKDRAHCDLERESLLFQSKCLITTRP